MMQVDKEHRYCYLESSNVANNKFYHSLGFETKRQIEFTRSEPPVILDVMTREPHPCALSHVNDLKCTG